jgi:putative acetyltransferase
VDEAFLLVIVPFKIILNVVIWRQQSHNRIREGFQMTEILNAIFPEQIEQVRALMRAFVDWHRERHIEDHALIDEYFNFKDFEEELASLPGKYSPPRGRLLLALKDGQPAGCAALHEIDAQACEMKRMFVYPQFQGQGVGRALAEALIQEARTIGYTSILLDTSFRQAEAQGLYQSLGFKRIKPYYELPEELQNWLVFMKLKL